MRRFFSWFYFRVSTFAIGPSKTTVQPRYSSIPWKTLYSLANPLLPFPMFTLSHERLRPRPTLPRPTFPLCFSSRDSLFATRYSLSSPFSHSYALSCTVQNRNPFYSKYFRTLCAKHPGWGVLPRLRRAAKFHSPRHMDHMPRIASHQSRITSHHSLSPSESALTKNASITRLESALPKTQHLKSFRIRT